MKNTSRPIALLLVVVMILAMAGCSGGSSSQASPSAISSSASAAASESPASTVEKNGPDKLVRMSMATGGTTGGMYIIGGGISNVLLQKMDNLDITAEVTGGTMDNLGLVNNGDCELGLSNADFAQWAYEGAEPFTQPYNFSAVATLYPSAVHIIARNSANIEGVADMKGKKVATGPLGSGNRLNSEKILNFCGVTLDEITSYDYTNGEMIDALKDGDIDAIILITGAPVSQLIDLFMTADVHFVTLPEEMREGFIAKYSYFQKLTLPADMYGTQTDIDSLGVMNLLLVNNEIDEDTVYWITKGIMDNLEAIHDVHVLISELDVETAIVTSVPLHPGAERYFREIGAIS